MSQYLIMLSCLLSVLQDVESEVITVQEGQDANIKCSHTFARGNVKYFCRHPCTYNDVLITSESQHYYQSRFSLVDHGTGDFTITFSKVRSTDSGIYYCGVERFIKDTSTEVHLKVVRVPSSIPSYTSNRPSKATAQTTWPGDTSVRQLSRDHEGEDREDDASEEDDSEERAALEQAEGEPSGLVYIGAGLAVVVFVLVLSLFMLYTQKTRSRKTSAPSAGHTSNTGSGNNHQVQCDYADVTISPGNPTSSHTPPETDPSAIYSNVPPPFNQNPDSVDYSTVRFDRDEESLQYSTVRFTAPPAGGDRQRSNPGSVIYSTINL
ncbi:uncharacterized protein LOC143099191 [Alosa pseudoharengus]|uniref:uncharacterized protein LOC143099191 n=1 Tax=Alosa pseudoharengus TaxID=34774 RepID=UPI003F8903E2